MARAILPSSVPLVLHSSPNSTNNSRSHFTCLYVLDLLRQFRSPAAVDQLEVATFVITADSAVAPSFVVFCVRCPGVNGPSVSYPCFMDLLSFLEHSRLGGPYSLALVTLWMEAYVILGLVCFQRCHLSSSWKCILGAPECVFLFDFHPALVNFFWCRLSTP